MSADEFAAELGKEMGVSKHQAKKIISAFRHTTLRCVLGGQRVNLSGLLTIYYDVLPESKSYNISKGETVKLPKRMGLKIIPSPDLKKKVRAKNVY